MMLFYRQMGGVRTQVAGEAASVLWVAHSSVPALIRQFDNPPDYGHEF